MKNTKVKRQADELGNVKRKRVVLNIETKVQIKKKIDEGSSIKNLCDIYHIGSSIIYDLKKHKKDTLKFYGAAHNPDLLCERKTIHQAKNGSVDKVLIKWIS